MNMVSNHFVQQELQPFQLRKGTVLLKLAVNLVFHCTEEGIDENTLQTQV